MSYTYKSTEVKIVSTVSGYSAGDYAKIYSNNGDGAVVTTAALDQNSYALDGTHSNDELAIGVSVRVHGWWLFQVWAYDRAGNKHTGTPDEQGIWPLLQPVKSKRPVIEDYNNTTKDLIISRRQ